MVISWGTIINGGVSAAKFISKESNRNFFQKIYYSLFRKKRKILILGASGSGKSQFIESLKNSKGLVVVPRTHESESMKIDFFDYPIEVRDTPGHESKKELRLIELDRLILQPVEGIINVVSYGFSEAPEAGRNIAIKNKILDKDFIIKNREYEIEQINEWVNRVRPNRNVKWIITLVTKADLWWENYEEVNEHYTNGSYGKKINGLNIPMYTLPYCSIIKPFFKIQEKNTFGEVEKDALKNVFFKTVINILKNN